MDKQELIRKINSIHQLVQKYPNLLTKEDDIKNILDRIHNFNAKVLIVGGFSAGKSALLNACLNEELLAEAIRPETALATELVYGNDQIKLIDKNDNEDIISKDEVDSIIAEDFKKCIYSHSNNFLKSMEKYMLVDMPGFNSGIEAHNKALLQYINQGAGAIYLLVIDAAQGTVNSSDIEFLREVSLYSENIACVITKCDKLSEEELATVANHVKKTLKSVLGKEIDVVCTSKWDVQVSKKIETLIKAFDYDKMLYWDVQDKLDQLVNNVSVAFTSRMNALDFDSFELDKLILELSYKRDSLVADIEHEKAILHQKLQNESKFKVLDSIKVALETNVHELIEASIVGKGNFSEVVNKIIRPILVQKVNQEVEIQFEAITQRLDDKIFNALDGVAVSNSLRNVMDGVSNLARNKQFLDGLKKYKSLYRVISTGLALATSVVAPVLEFVLIILPDVIDWFNQWRIKCQREEIKANILQEVIPKIIEKIELELSSTFLDVEEELIQELKEKYQEQLDVIKSNLESVKKEKDDKFVSCEEEKRKIESDIYLLQSIFA